MSLWPARQGVKGEACGHARRSRMSVCVLRLADVAVEVGDASWLCGVASAEGER